MKSDDDRIGEEGEAVESAPSGTQTVFTDHDVAQLSAISARCWCVAGRFTRRSDRRMAKRPRRLPIDLVEMVDTASDTKIAVFVANICLVQRGPFGRWRATSRRNKLRGVFRRHTMSTGTSKRRHIRCARG